MYYYIKEINRVRLQPKENITKSFGFLIITILAIMFVIMVICDDPKIISIYLMVLIFGSGFVAGVLWSLDVLINKGDEE
jgi:hypothetical protein